MAAGTLAALSAGCAATRPTASTRIESDSGSRDADVLEGFYAICGGAYAHRETLVLHDGGFEHFIETHGIYGSRSTGRYTVVGDTIALQIEQTGPAPDGDRRPIPPVYDFVIGEIGERPVLWRGKATARQYSSGTAGFPEYGALFHRGPDSARGQVPSCHEVSTRGRVVPVEVGVYHSTVRSTEWQGPVALCLIDSQLAGCENNPPFGRFEETTHGTGVALGLGARIVFGSGALRWLMDFRVGWSGMTGSPGAAAPSAPE